MERFPNLMELNLSFNQFFDLAALLKELSKLKKITSLDLRANKFNIHYDFDSIIPHGGNLASLEALEKYSLDISYLIRRILKPSSENQFNNFISYRFMIISALTDSLLTLDRITITSYEISLSQYQQPSRFSTDRKNLMASPTPTVDATLNIGGPSLFDANFTSSIDTAFTSVMFMSDKKQPGGTGSFNPLHSELDDSLAYSKGLRSQNTTAQKMNASFTPPPKEQKTMDLSPSEVSVKARSRYQQEADHNSQIIHSGTMVFSQEELKESRESGFNPFRKSVTMAMGPELRKINQDKGFQNQIKATQSDPIPEDFNSNMSAMSFAMKEKRSSSFANSVSHKQYFLVTFRISQSH